MRKKLSVGLISLLIGFPLFADNSDGNPFKKFGYHVEVGTFGEGEEFHDGKEVVEIGLALYNTRTNKVVGFVGEKDVRIELAKDIISTSIDPHCERYYSISPYAYCFNNPVRFIDPDGRDVWEINQNGEIVNRIEDTTQDAFFMVDKDGNRTYTTDNDGNKVYNSIKFEYGTIESQRTIALDSKRSYDVYQVRGDEHGTALFEFMSHNVTGSSSLVEFSQAMTGIEGKKGLNFITTSHDAKHEAGMSALLNSQLLYGYTIRELNHSHPISNYPSGRNSNPLSGDIGFKADVLKNTNKNGRKAPDFFIYHVPSKTYIPY